MNNQIVRFSMRSHFKESNGMFECGMQPSSSTSIQMKHKKEPNDFNRIKILLRCVVVVVFKWHMTKLERTSTDEMSTFRHSICTFF